jgi:hypothetical protein
MLARLDRGGVVMNRRLGLLAGTCVLAMVAVSCGAGTISGDESDSAEVTTTAISPPAEEGAASTTFAQPSTTSEAELEAVKIWMRTPNDDEVFGSGEGHYGEVTMSHVVWGEFGFVALGMVDLGCPEGGASCSQRTVVWTSSDGEEWKRFEQPELGSVRDVIVTGAGLIAVGSVPRPDETVTWEHESDNCCQPGIHTHSWEPYDAAIWTSQDGTTWQRIAHTEELEYASVSSVIAHEDAFVAFGGTDQVRSLGDGKLSCDGVPYDPTAEGAACEGSFSVWVSQDGNTWTRHEPVVDGSIRDMVSTTEGLLAVGRKKSDCEPTEWGEDCLWTPKVWRSADGIEWREIPDLDRLFGQAEDEFTAWVNSAASVDDTVVVVGGMEGSGTSQRLVWVSRDAGDSWEQREEPIDAWSVTASGDGYFVLLAERRLAISRNAIDWTIADIDALGANDFVGSTVIAGERIVAVGTSGGWRALALSADWMDVFGGD